jgi:hypothetical protein
MSKKSILTIDNLSKHGWSLVNMCVHAKIMFIICSMNFFFQLLGLAVQQKYKLYEEPIFHHTGSSTIPNLKLQDATATSLESVVSKKILRTLKTKHSLLKEIQVEIHLFFLFYSIF